MFADALLVARKDLAIEWRSRVVTNQIAPFTVLILVLFGFALDADTQTLRDTAPGLFWIAVLLVALLAIQRAVRVETDDGAHHRLLLSSIDPASIFLGKAMALFAQLLALEVLLLASVLILFNSSVDRPALAICTAVVATAGISSAGTLYGVLAVGSGVRETLLPILLLPVLAPVLISATRAFGDAFDRVDVDGWAWLGMLGVFAVIYTLFGLLAYGALLEDS
jgi:heme exporter protein B